MLDMMRRARVAGVIGLLPLLCGTVEARTPRAKTGVASHHPSSLAQRRRLNVDSLITEPGTVEMEWYGVFWWNGAFSVPTVWKVTPGKESGFWARTELSASFNAVAGQDVDSSYVVQSTDHLTFAATTVVGGLGPIQIAVAPTVTFWLRGDTGSRIGAAVYAKAEGDRHQGGLVMNWSGATTPSPTNPAGTFDASGAYGFRLGRQGLLGKLTAHTSLLGERSTGYPWFMNLSEGLEYDVNEELSFDLSGQQLNLRTGSIENQIILGVTWNLGRFRRH